MLTHRMVKPLSTARDRLARALVHLGVTPNALTYSGLILSAGAGMLFMQGAFRLAGVIVLFAGACDVLDGAVAREGELLTRLGQFLDSSLDRYADALVLGGIICHYALIQDLALMGAAVSALVGSLLVSYMRGRAESLIDSCKVGFWERPERCVLLMVGALLHRVAPAVWLLAVLTHVTVLQRIVHTHWVLKYGHPMFRPAQADLFAARGESSSLTRRMGIALARLVFWDHERGSIPYDLALLALVAFLLLAPIR